MLSSAKAAEVLTQAVLLHPMLGARWRWNLNRALVLPRMNGGKRRPIHLQRMEADDLLAAVWPGLAACQENAPPGPVGVPDHVLARQTVVRLPARGALRRGARRGVGPGRVGCHRRAHGRVVGALSLLPRHLERTTLHLPRRRAARGAAHARPLAAARPGRARAPTACPSPPPSSLRSTPTPWRSCSTRSVPGCATPTSCTTSCSRWSRRGRARSGRSGTTRSPPTAGPARSTAAGWRRSAATAALALGDDDDAAAACVAGHLQLAGPVTVEQLVADAALPSGRTDGRAAVAGPGPHGPGPPRRQGLGHRAARRSLVRPQPAGAPARREPQPPPRPWSTPVPIAEYVRFLTHWQHATPDSRARGPGRTARSARAAAGDRGAGGGVGGADPARPRQRTTTPAGSTSSACPARSCGAGSRPRAERTGRSGTPSPATPLAFVRARRPRGHAARRARRVRWRPSPRSARRPTCSRRCGSAAPASAPSWRR